MAPFGSSRTAQHWPGWNRTSNLPQHNVIYSNLSQVPTAYASHYGTPTAPVLHALTHKPTTPLTPSRHTSRHCPGQTTETQNSCANAPATNRWKAVYVRKQKTGIAHTPHILVVTPPPTGTYTQIHSLQDARSLREKLGSHKINTITAQPLDRMQLRL